jgi:hypothetical protein
MALVFSSGPMTPASVAPFLGRATPAPQQDPQRPPPPAAGAPTRRPPPRSGRAPESNPWGVGTLSLPFPGCERWRARRIPANRADHRPRGPHCKEQRLSKVFSMIQGYTCELQIFPGASLQNRISNSTCVLLILVSSVENRRRIGKCKTNFVGFLVKNTTTFVIFV